MPTYNDRGFPLYADGETFPGWAAAFNSQSNLLSTAMDTSEAAAEAAWSVDTIAEIPAPVDSTRGQLLYCAEDELLYVFDGTGWYAFAGKLPYFYGSRSNLAVGSGSARQGFLTATDYTRGITRTTDTLTFETVGIYRAYASVVWEANPSGQRNLGFHSVTTPGDIQVLGQEESYAFPSSTVEVSQNHTTDILVTAPGATIQPYVTHNSGAALDVYGSASFMWVSA